jgi:hypothetical protein
MTFKFDDTEVLGELHLASGTYILAHSEECEAAYGAGYTVRHYREQKRVEPYMDEADDNIDFTDLAGGLADLGAFPTEDLVDLAHWLTEEMDRPPLTEAEQARMHVLRQTSARDLFRDMTREGKKCRLLNDDTQVEFEFSPGHFVVYDAKVRLQR